MSSERAFRERDAMLMRGDMDDPQQFIEDEYDATQRDDQRDISGIGEGSGDAEASDQGHDQPVF
jgi:hypothetical protein